MLQCPATHPCAPAPATFSAAFVPGPALCPRPVHVWGLFCSRACLVPPPQPRLVPLLFLALPCAPAPSTFRGRFVPGPALCPRPVHVSGLFCSRACLSTLSRPRFVPFLCPGPSNSQTVKPSNSKVCPYSGSKFVWVFCGVG